MNYLAKDIVVDGENVYWAGPFTRAGGKAAFRLAVWRDPGSVLATGPRPHPGTTLHSIYPNPFAGNSRLRYEVSHAGYVAVEMYDLLGRRVATLVDAPQMPGTYEVELDGRTLASGNYVCTLRTESNSDSRIITVLK